jgi:hypothetical protein
MESSGYTLSIWERLQINILRAANVLRTLVGIEVTQYKAGGGAGDDKEMY